MKHLAWIAALGLAACASEPKPDVVPASAGLGTTAAPDPTPLASYDIPSGRCGMILWTKDSGRVAPIFRSIDTVQASMIIEGETVPLLLASQDGDLRFGMRAQQVFTPTDPEKHSTVVETKLEWGQAFPGGIYINRGSLKLTATDGWQRILPVAGIAGCKA